MDLPSINPSSLNSIGNTVQSLGNANSLSQTTDAVSNGLSAIGSFFKKLNGVNLPLKNPLFAYASYDYVIGLGILSADEINNPDSTYIAGNPVHLIAKSANADPANRVNTLYGKFDFFIDNLQLKSLIGMELGNNTNVLTLSFNIIEPYSMGMFYVAAQQLAGQLGHTNWREAPFIITIEFRGNTETGTMSKIPNTTRYIPFTFAALEMTSDSNGSKYICKGLVWGQQAWSDAQAKLKGNFSARGASVQEILQSGENSLQSAWNKNAQAIADKQGIKVADKVLILFPTDPTSAKSVQTSVSQLEKAVAPTTDNASKTDSVNPDLLKRLQVSRSDINNDLVQETYSTNVIGQASMQFDEKKKADVPIGAENVVYNTKSGNFNNSKNTAKSTVSVFSFQQDQKIWMAINAVILQSKFVDDTLQPSAVDENGCRGWWNIQSEHYFLSNEVNTVTGTKPTLTVYKVIPYKTHVSKLMDAGVKPPGYANLNGQAVKEYNYMYTGKNVDVLDFKLKFNASFTIMMPATPPSSSIDAKDASKQGGTRADIAPVNGMAGSSKAPEPGTMAGIVKFVKRLTGTDLIGGGGQESEATRAAKAFHDAVTEGLELQVLRMKIIGDPYFIVQSGAGNYTSQPSQYFNLNSDGTVNWQNGEVDIRVNFRSPIDINQNTGLYNFGGTSAGAPVVHFSGLYQIILVNSTFSSGVFTQELKGLRRPLYESKQTDATSDQLYSTSAKAVDKKDSKDDKDV